MRAPFGGSEDRDAERYDGPRAHLFVKAILELMLWSQLPHVAGRGWLIGDGLITLILALMIASTWPSSAAWVVDTLIGISMFFAGTSPLMLSLAFRRMRFA